MQIPSIGGSSGPSLGALKKTSRSLEKILEQLSTAQRINRASDDAAGLSISEQLRTQIHGFKMAEQNVTDAMAALDIADGTSTEVSDMLQRQRELALQANSDTLTTDQRQSLNVEYQQLTQEISRIANSTQYNSQNVTAGQGIASGAGQIQVGPNAGDQITVPAINITAEALGVAGTSIADRTSAANALTTIDSALQSLNSQRADVGAQVNRMESIQNNIMVSETNTQAAESVLRDQDMAAGITDLTTQRLLQEGGLRAFARYNEISTNHLLGLLQ